MIQELLDTRFRYETFNHFKNWYYDRFLEYGLEHYEASARQWLIRQVYERAAWSVRFSAFLVSIGKKGA